MLLNARMAYAIAHKLERRLARVELKALCDAETGWTLGGWEVEQLTKWVEEHPAYKALPEESGEPPRDHRE